MRKMATFTMLLLGLTVYSFAWAEHHGDHDEESWFDHDASCQICKSFSSNQDLMASTKWETHKTKNGMLMTAMVPEEKLDSYRGICKKMEKTAAKIEKGEAKAEDLCGFCQGMGKLLEAGAKMEKIETGFGGITLITSDKPETIKKIHAFAERSQQEAKKMLAMMNR